MDFAFVGTANAVFEPRTDDGIISGGDPAGFAFSVELAWKGVATDTLTVWSPQSDAACGYRFRVGQRYLLPTPSPVAASLLAREFKAPRFEGPSLIRQLPVDCEESADILSAEVDPSRSIPALTAMAYRLLESNSAEYRAAAVEGLGTLTRADELVRALRHRFTDQGEPARAAARQAPLSRHTELATQDADECVAAFIASIGAIPAQSRWVGVHQLRYFPAQHDRIRPFLEAVADTAQEPMILKTALEVLKALPSK